MLREKKIQKNNNLSKEESERKAELIFNSLESKLNAVLMASALMFGFAISFITVGSPEEWRVADKFHT